MDATLMTLNHEWYLFHMRKSMSLEKEPFGQERAASIGLSRLPVRRHFLCWVVMEILHMRCQVRVLLTNFHFLSVFVVSEKKFMVQCEGKLKESAQANLERNRQRFERKK